MRRRYAALLSIAFAVVFVGAARFAVGCLDTTPIVVPPRDTAPPRPDVTGDGGVVSLTPCLDCIIGSEDAGVVGQCVDVADKCRTDPVCGKIFVCAVADRCFEGTTLDDKINCGLPCAVDAGVVSVTDPAIQLLVDVLRCSEQLCALPCNVGDGGVGANDP